MSVKFLHMCLPPCSTTPSILAVFLVVLLGGSHCQAQSMSRNISSPREGTLAAAPLVTEWSYAEKGDAVFRDADTLGVHYGHAGIFLGNNRWTGGVPLFINAPGYRYSWERLVIDQPVVVTDFQGFRTDAKGSHDFWGVRDYSLNWKQRDAVVAAALAQQGCKYGFVMKIKNPSTTPIVWEQPYYYMPGLGHPTHADGDFRCDELVEYAYEQAGVNSGQGLFSRFEEGTVFGVTPRLMMDRMSGPLVAPPLASGFSPAPGSTVGGVASVNCYLTDQDWGSGVERAEFSMPQGGLFRNVTDGHEVAVGGMYGAAWDTRLAANGPQTIYVTAYDQAGNYKTYSWQVTVRNPSAAVVSESDPAAYDGAPGFFRHGTPGYWHAASGVGDGGRMLWTWNNANFIDNMGDWRPNLVAPGHYEVSVFIPRLHGTTTHAHYEIYHADGRTDVIVNQNNIYDAWVSLGTYRFVAGTSGLLRLTDMTGERGVTAQIGFDSARWLPRD